LGNSDGAIMGTQQIRKGLRVRHEHGRLKPDGFEANAGFKTIVDIDPYRNLKKFIEIELDNPCNLKVLMKDGKWLVEESERPKGWQELLCWQGATNQGDELISHPYTFAGSLAKKAGA
jgi:hypothetical protein